MRDNLFHASTAESIRSRHAETYLRKMRSADAGGANATTAGLNSSIPEESRSLDSAGLPPTLPRVFAYPSRKREREREPAIFHPINRDGRQWRKAAPSLAFPRLPRNADGAICRVIIFIAV